MTFGDQHLEHVAEVADETDNDVDNEMLEDTASS